MIPARRLPFLAAAIALALAPSLPAMAQQTPAAPAQAGQQAQDEKMPEGRVLPDIALGRQDAPLTVIEYASFTCSHCKAFHDDVWPRLKADYIDTGKVRFIQRDIYFDAVGLWAGVLARCAGDDRYYAVSDLLFDDQDKWLSGQSGDDIAANLRKLGTKAGMTDAQMDACWNDRQKVADLLATFQKNASADGIEGTPTFVIGGEKVQNQPWEDLRKIIDAKLAASSAPASPAAAPAAPAKTPAPAAPANPG